MTPSSICGRASFIVILTMARLSWAGTPLLIVAPDQWVNAATNFAAFKARLGYDVEIRTLNEFTGGATNEYAAVRAALHDFYSSLDITQRPAYVLFVGDFHAIPCPLFKVVTNESASYYSDLYYAVPDVDFDANTNHILAEYGPTGDVTEAVFDTFFAGLTNRLVVGRIPIPATCPPDSVETLLDRSISFERETGDRKRAAFLTAGRIDTLFTADSWDYVVKNLAGLFDTNYPTRSYTTVIHIASNHADRTGMDYMVEGDNLSTCYTLGQNIVRTLWQSNNQCAFLCNVSHGSSTYDFALRRNGSGLPSNVNAAIVMSLSCSSYELAACAHTAGVVVAYLASTAIVTPDVLTILSGQTMVSAKVQQRAACKIFGDRLTVGQTFRDEFDYYIQQIPVVGWMTYANSKAEILRNVVGFQIVGDPTLAIEYDDQDGDALLDPEEIQIGTLIDNPDTDGDGLPDGYEVYRPGLNPLVSNGTDTDSDHVLNADELFAGTDPLDSDEFARIDGHLNADRTAILTWMGITGRTYRVEYNPSLIEPDWTLLDLITNGMGTPIQFTPDVETNTTQFRLLITGP